MKRILCKPSVLVLVIAALILMMMPATALARPNGNHNWSPWTEVFAPSCEVDGEESRHCYSCGQDRRTGQWNTVETQAIPAIGHAWGEWGGTEPTCEDDGYRERLCGNNEAHLDHEVLPALGHLWGEWVVTKEPTVDEKGERVRVCDRDETHIEFDEIDKLEPEEEEEEEAEKKKEPVSPVTPKTGDATKLMGAFASVFVALSFVTTGFLARRKKNKS